MYDRQLALLAVEKFVNDVLTAWHESSSAAVTGPPDYTDLIVRHWNKWLIRCRRAPAYDYLVKCWQEREDPDPRLLGNAVCPWRTYTRSWK